MKTFIKSILYFSFAALIFSGCAKNDDFSIPAIVDPAEGLKETKSIEDIYSVITPTIAKYEADDIIKGIIVSTDKEQTFFKEIYFVDEKNNKAAVFKLDKYSTFVDYEIGSTVYIKLKDTYVQLNNGILSIGGQNGNFVGYLADPIFKKHIFASNKGRLSLKELEANYLTEVTLKEVIESNGTPNSYIGKLIRLKDVQFDKDARGNTFLRKGETSATFNIIESKESVTNPLGGKIGFRVAAQNKTFKDVKVADNSGTMTGVMSIFNKDFQFIPRFLTDLKLDQKPFAGDEGSEETLPQHEIKLSGVLAWLGADFNDFNAFLGTIEEFKGQKLPAYATEAKGQGWKDSNALNVKGKPIANDFIFTALDSKIPADAESITFLLKGKATGGKSISINIYNEDGKYDTAFNLGNVGADDLTLEKAVPSGPFNALNDYNGSINTKGRWIKVTLNLKGAKFNTSGKGKFFGFKVGKDGDYDILLDEFRVVGGKDGGTDPEIPTNGTVLSDFDNVNGIEWINANYAVVEAGKGIDGKSKGLVINGDKSKADTAYRLSDVKVPANAKKITLKLKGTSKGRSLVFNVFDKEIKSNFYSLKDVKSDISLDGEGSTNAYKGEINTNNKWIKVTLNLPAGNISNSGAGKFFEIRLGGKEGGIDSNYDLVVDDIMFE